MSEDHASLLYNEAKKLADWYVTSQHQYTVRLPIACEELKAKGLKLTLADLKRNVRHIVAGIKVESKKQSTTTNKDKTSGNGAVGREATFPDCEPCDDPVDGVLLINTLREVFERHIVFKDKWSSQIAALWCIGTFAMPAWYIFPRLVIYAPYMGCGKSTLLTLVGMFCYRKLQSEDVTASSLFRVIESHQPTLLLDEADESVRHNKEVCLTVRSGYWKGGSTMRSVVVDGEWETRQFLTYAATALASIRPLEPRIMDRAVQIELARKTKEEKVESFSERQTDLFDKLRKQIARWIVDNMATLASANPRRPEDIINRAADNWFPMFAIADAISAQCGNEIRAIALGENTKHEEGSHGIMLLSDIRDMFLSKSRDFLSSVDILRDLLEMHHRPWPEYGKDQKPLSHSGLNRLLQPYGLRSKDVKRNGEVIKGFQRKWFDDVFSRYLQPLPVQAVPDDSDSFWGAAAQ